MHHNHSYMCKCAYSVHSYIYSLKLWRQDWENMIIMMMKHLLLICLLVHIANGAGKPPARPVEKKWLTLHGGDPVVVANGGLSGVFPESSWGAYTYGIPQSLMGSPMLCDLKLSKDGFGYCMSKMLLQNATTVSDTFPNARKTYDVNGEKLTGWFGLDFNAQTLFENITLIQGLFTRPSSFDNSYTISSPESLEQLGTGQDMPIVWINVEYDNFYQQHKLSIESYLEDMLPAVKINVAYISSPEIGFLKSIGPKVAPTVKLFFKFPSDLEAVEPSTSQKYGSLIKQLKMIKGFAAGILVPKDFIWPVNKDRYLEASTTLVTDAHKQGLEVFAYGFANDNYIPYNYSLDPANEYLQFIDNSHFSVDGVVTDFCSTASNVIACLAHNNNASRVLKTLVISHNGASGDYPGGSDLAYQKAIDDGTDIIDCNVQLSKDGVAFCQDSADLKFTTTAGTTFMDKVEEIKEVNDGQPGIFSFGLTWDEIQSLKPKISSPYEAPLDRNHAYQFAGKFMTLPEFLELAKAKAVPGIMVGLENAAYLATKGHDLIGTVTSALKNASFDKQTKQKVMIKSDDSSVLLKFKNDTPSYERVLVFKRDFSSVPDQSLAEEVKKYADAISMRRNSLVLEYGDPYYMTRNFTNVVHAMHAANVSVYASNLKNEFQSFLFDYNSDPYQEIATLVSIGVDGLITDFPATAVAYMRSPCSDPKANLPYTISAVAPGDMFNNSVAPLIPDFDPKLINMTTYPALSSKDIISEALPPVAQPNTTASPDSSTTTTTAPPPKESSSTSFAPTSTALFLVTLAAILLAPSF
ncbi:unnamed protein product [Cuscuta epithymum]|uniref:glycerophosphodiester phosphodiesterase n=2 Tax=Cuscuta epithymum TaxID=186058 RepID=A0AAV0C783_9ASTE|nr:unnamed protein product [Cuscuta epithymum]